MNTPRVLKPSAKHAPLKKLLRKWGRRLKYEEEEEEMVVEEEDCDEFLFCHPKRQAICLSPLRQTRSIPVPSPPRKRMLYSVLTDMDGDFLSCRRKLDFEGDHYGF